MKDAESLLAIVYEGTRRRQTAATKRNSASSRSHALIELVTPQATLHLADLAGRYKYFFCFSVTSYIREDLVLRHSVPHYPPNFSKHFVLSGRTYRRAFAVVPERRNEHIKK